MHLVHGTVLSKKDTGITVLLVVCGFPKCREGEVPPHFQPHYKIRNCCHESNGILK